MASDFHTHSAPPPGIAALVSTGLDQLGRFPLESLEFHPWRLPPQPVELPREFAAGLEQAAALGEIGLDRLRGPAFPVQQQMLDRLLCLAAEQEKPVVFHCVRATAELLAAVKPYPRMRKLLHGFRGSPELFEEFRKHGFYLSLGAAALERAPLLDHLRRTGFDRVGFETDDRPEPVEQLIERAAGVLGCPAERLTAATDANFREFLQR